MPRRRPIVTYRRPDPALLPAELVQATLIVSDLEERGIVDAVARRLHIERQGGFAGVDVWLLLLVFLASNIHGGLRPFWSVLGPFSKRVAALGRRSNLPSPGAASRALSRVDNDLLRPQTAWLLTEAPAVDHVLKHPSVLHYDALGDGWHVFDVDPTVTTLRQRSLPVGDDLPDPVRRSEHTAAPGHAGRKRGDVQYRRVDVQHAGAGLFVHAHLHRGNGDGTDDLALALGSVDALLTRLSLAKTHALVRLDGEHGTVPYFHILRKHALPFITRANYPSLYDDPNVLVRLRGATWVRVPDSGAGPTRVAADLGVVELSASRSTKQADGSAYEPLQIRIVASAFEKEGPVKRGRKLDGWQVELFAADVPADAWPASEVVAAYFGRSSQENRFAQEDREVGLDRIVSYHLPGQELATLTGLFLLNYRIARGFELDPPPDERPLTTLRVPIVDKRMPVGWPREPVVARLLQTLNWTDITARHPGWTWNELRGALSCPDGGLMDLTSVRPDPSSSKKTAIIFRQPRPRCVDCTHRVGSLDSGQVEATKHLELAVDTELANQLRKRLERLRRRPDAARGVRLEPITDNAGLHAVVAPRFLPREARRAFEQLFHGACLRVVVHTPPPRPPRPRLVAEDDADRQKRRTLWAQRAARYAATEDTVVSLDIATDRPIGRWLRGAGKTQEQGVAVS